jgi:hypothetical protein
LRFEDELARQVPAGNELLKEPAVSFGHVIPDKPKVRSSFRPPLSQHCAISFPAAVPR